MRRPRVAWIGLCIWWCGICPALAQPISAPVLPGGGLFGSRRTGATASGSPELTLTANLGGGYDQTPTVSGDLEPPALVADQSGRVGTVAGNLSFRAGSIRNAIEVAGGGYFNQASVGVRQVTGGDGSVEWTAAMGRRSGLLLRANATYQPTFLFNAYGPITDQVEEGLPTSAPTLGINEERWLSTQGQLAVYRNWSPRQRGDIRYMHSQQQPLSGPGFDSWSQTVGYTHLWNRTERFAIRPTYTFGQNRQRDETGRELPLDSHAATLVLTYTKRLSPQRLFTMSGGVGYTYSLYDLPTGTQKFNLPTYSGLARLGVGSDWSVSIDAARDVTVLEGLSPEPYSANAVSIRTDGLVGRRAQFALSVGYSGGGGLVTQSGSFETIVGAAQMQIALGRRWAVYSGFSHYRYDLASLFNAAALPTRYRLNAFRAGLNLWLPLYGRL